MASSSYSLPSASGVERAFQCAGSAVLPQIDQETSPQAEFGTWIHLYLQRLNEGVDQDTALEEIKAEFRDFCSNLPLERLPILPGKVIPEFAIALDLESGQAKELGRATERDYRPVFTSGRQINMTGDVLALMGEDGVYVADYKTGSDAYVSPAEENRQLKTLALGACLLWGRTRARAELIFIRDGFSWTRGADYDWPTLQAHFEELRATEARIIAAAQPGAQLELYEGGWCRYCPAFKVCPAKRELASSLVVGVQDQALTLPLAPETIPTIWQRLGEAQLLLDAIKATVESFCQDNPVRLDNGLVLGPVESTTKRLDAGKLHDLLRERFGFEVADKAVSSTTSEERIKAALKPIVEERKAQGEKVSQAGLLREIKAALEEAGGVEFTRTCKVKPHKPTEADLVALTPALDLSLPA